MRRHSLAIPLDGFLEGAFPIGDVKAFRENLNHRFSRNAERFRPLGAFSICIFRFDPFVTLRRREKHPRELVLLMHPRARPKVRQFTSRGNYLDPIEIFE
jgi:hypothetical protein